MKGGRGQRKGVVGGEMGDRGPRNEVLSLVGEWRGKGAGRGGKGGGGEVRKRGARRAR